MKSYRAISLVKCLYETDVQIPEDDDRDGPRNVGFVQTPDMADSPKRLHRIWLSRKLKSRIDATSINHDFVVYEGHNGSRDGSVGIALGYGLDDQGSISDTTSRLTLEPTQPPIQCVPGVLFPGIKLTTLAPRLRIRGAIPPLPNAPSCRGAQLKHRDNFITQHIGRRLKSQIHIKSVCHALHPISAH
jgi:hypothetical protein